MSIPSILARQPGFSLPIGAGFLCCLHRRAVEKGPVRALVVNSGNANACTGPQGVEDTLQMAHLVAGELSINSHEVLWPQPG